jgi:hemoglobin/transferrin/lactoferrin receptor protein
MSIVRTAILLFLFLFLSSFINAQTEGDDSLKIYTFEEAVISVNKEAELVKTVPSEVFILKQKDIEKINAFNTADLLFANGIQVQKSQMGGGSPVLRGFEASRIVLVVDGVRLNNLIYRTGHLQDIVKTDVNSLERLEVLYGPASNRYGSDALGGVIHLFTKKPKLAVDSLPLFNLSAMTAYNSVCNGFSGHLDFNVGKRRFASFSSFSYNKFGDLRSGKTQNPFYKPSYGERNFYAGLNQDEQDTVLSNKNPHLQIGSGYSQYDIVQKFLFKQRDNIAHGINLQFSNSSDVPRYDRLTDPSSATILKFAEWYYGPQTRFLAAYDLNYRNPALFFESVHFGLNYQYLTESRHTRSFGSSFLNSRIENVQVIASNLDFKKTLSRHELRFGYDIQLNFLKSTAFKTNIYNDTTAIISSRYPDGNNNLNHFALYFSHNWKINEQLTLVDGLRLGYSTLFSTIADNEVMFNLPYNQISQQTPVYSGSAGLVYTVRDELKISTMVSTGFRVPNVDDLSKIFESAPGAVIVPNRNLRPEKTISYELGISNIFAERFRLENSVYYSDFFDIVLVDKFTFNGSDSLVYDGVNSAVFANQNKESAYIVGFSSRFSGRIIGNLFLNLSANYNYGRIKTDSTDIPLDHIPPLLLRGSLSFVNKKFSAEVFSLYNGWKRLKDYFLNGEDNEQYATPLGMPAWFTLNLTASYNIHKNIILKVGIENILDTRYRTFASGINAPGRNFQVALRAKF